MLFSYRIYTVHLESSVLYLKLTAINLSSLEAQIYDISLNSHANGSRVSIALIRLCDSVCVSVCPHDKNKTAKIKIAKLGTEIVHHDISPMHQLILGQKVKGQDHRVKKCKSIATRC